MTRKINEKATGHRLRGVGQTIRAQASELGQGQTRGSLGVCGSHANRSRKCLRFAGLKDLFKADMEFDQTKKKKGKYGK